MNLANRTRFEKDTSFIDFLPAALNFSDMYVYMYVCIGGHESTAVLLLGTFELSNLIAIKKLF